MTTHHASTTRRTASARAAQARAALGLAAVALVAAGCSADGSPSTDASSDDAPATAAGSSPDAGATPTGTPRATPQATNPATGLPTHMKPDHDGPATVSYLPVMCPGGPGSSTITAPMPTQPVSPVQFCTQRGEMGDVDPAKALPVESRFAIFLQERPASSSATTPASAEDRAAVAKEALPDGFTFDGNDYQVYFAMPGRLQRADPSCKTTDEMIAEVDKRLADSGNTTWASHRGGPQPDQGFKAACPQVVADVRTRTVTVYDGVGDGDRGSGFDPDPADWDKIQAVHDAVNGACLKAGEAKNALDAAAKTQGLSTGQSVVAKLVPAANTCARAYTYTVGGYSFIIFGG